MLGGGISLVGTTWTLDASAEQARIDRRVEAYADFSSIMTGRFVDVTSSPTPEFIPDVDRQALLQDLTPVADAFFRLQMVASSKVSWAASVAFGAYNGGERSGTG